MEMKKTILLLAMLVVVASATGAYADMKQASATLKDTGGHEIGLARFTQDGGGPVHVVVHVKGLAPGLHGIHVHENGRCDPTFAAAGGHFNPQGKKHGLDTPAGPHGGDLPNLVVNQSGEGYLDTTTDRATLSPGPASLFTGNGTAFVIHARPDDQKTDPSGNSGDRIACGVIKAI